MNGKISDRAIKILSLEGRTTKYRLVFRRKGRRMDNITSKTALKILQYTNNDNYCKVEINFPAELDPQFR